MPLYPVHFPPIGSQFPSKPSIPKDVSSSAPKRENNCTQCNHIHAPNQRVIRLPEALQITGLSRSTFLDLQNPRSRYFDPHLPQKILLSLRSVGWIESELMAWVESRRQVGQKGQKNTRVDAVVNYGIPIQPLPTSTFSQAPSLEKGEAK